MVVISVVVTRGDGPPSHHTPVYVVINGIATPAPASLHCITRMATALQQEDYALSSRQHGNMERVIIPRDTRQTPYEWAYEEHGINTQHLRVVAVIGTSSWQQYMTSALQSLLRLSQSSRCHISTRHYGERFIGTRGDLASVSSLRQYVVTTRVIRFVICQA